MAKQKSISFEIVMLIFFCLFHQHSYFGWIQHFQSNLHSITIGVIGNEVYSFEGSSPTIFEQIASNDDTKNLKMCHRQTADRRAEQSEKTIEWNGIR